jgi:hypothetical protein
MAAAPIGIRRSILAGIVLFWTIVAGAVAAPLTILTPDWAELPMDTQQVLAPLGPEWNQLEPASRRKWLQVAERYPKMGKDEQVRVQRRMRDWAKLTPEQRKMAREKYRNVRQASPEQREALKKMWSEYEALPAAEKDRYKKPAAGTKQ